MHDFHERRMADRADTKRTPDRPAPVIPVPCIYCVREKHQPVERGVSDREDRGGGMSRPGMPRRILTPERLLIIAGCIIGGLIGWFIAEAFL